MEWRYQPGPGRQWSTWGQHSRLRYQREDYRINDGDQTLLGASYVHSLGGPRQGVLFASLFGGQENALQDRADGDKNMLGMRISGQFSPWANTEAWATLGVQQARYQQDNFLFATRRDDKQFDVGIGLIKRFGAGWSLRPSISHIRNRANIAINDYSRTDYSLTVQRDFR
ncbi:hypothetical protein [Chitinimonas arctica]|uniref:hypothetical protein n=1 Tax=Chitinimonas arctica TaxID=2594795 RepID=UPI001CC7C825|nr:hypothetical protein [Chitinimonas arctica]